MSLVIETAGLSRRYGRGNAGVHDLALAVPAGCIYGFLGPNGAGKTTTIRLLLGLLRADAGLIRICGAPAGSHAARSRVGALVEHPSLYGHLSGHDNLEVTRLLLGAPAARTQEVLDRVGLLGAARQRVREYSLGMRQRLGLALALLGQPRLLILDEPSNGLDPDGVVALRQLLRELTADGLTVFLSSHQLAEVEQVATQVGVIQTGQMRFQGTLAQLRTTLPHTLAISVANGRGLALRDFLRSLEEQVDTAHTDGVSVVNPRRPAADLNRCLIEAGFAISALIPQQASLEQLFFQFTQTGGGSHDPQ